MDARSLWRLDFVRWFLIFVDPYYYTSPKIYVTKSSFVIPDYENCGHATYRFERMMVLLCRYCISLTLCVCMCEYMYIIMCV